jgi:spermidine synthase
MYGGTVTQYGLTIGLFFSSLGVGSYLAQHFDENQHENFFRTQVYLALAAPLGFLLIIWLNTTELPTVIPSLAVQIVARSPVVVIGILSGFELPLLLSMVKSEYGDSAPSPQWVNKISNTIDTIGYTTLSAVFHTNREGKEYDTYSTVLAMDYLGGLGGSLIFVFILYPEIGLIPSIFVLALLNCITALLFSIRFTDRSWGLFQSEDRVIITHERATIFAACLLLTTVYAGAAVGHQTVNDQMTEYYMESLIEQEHPDDTIETDITSQYTTKHQQVVQYEREWVGDSENKMFAQESETCMRLDSAIQLCESWAESYHNGLVDVPMTMFENSSETDVLLVGGGDWIAVNHLSKYGVTVDQVDLDGEFMNNTKSNNFTRQYHEDAYEYENLTTHQKDIYTYLQNTDKEYDLILLDLPGAKSDDLLHLYSVEFYGMLEAHLSDKGVVTTWAYSEYIYGVHSKPYMNSVEAAGFEYMAEYHAYSDYNNDGSQQIGERFLIFAPDNNRPEITPTEGTKYVQKYSSQYSQADWERTPTYNDIQTNSIFHPNYDLIINDRVRARQEDY